MLPNQEMLDLLAKSQSGDEQAIKKVSGIIKDAKQTDFYKLTASLLHALTSSELSSEDSSRARGINLVAQTIVWLESQEERLEKQKEREMEYADQTSENIIKATRQARAGI